MAIRTQPKRIDSIVGNILSERGYFNACKEYDVVSKWKEIVGDKISEVTECSRVENGTLYVRVLSSCWRQELIYLKEKIIKEIKDNTKCLSINEIVFF